MDRGKKKSEPFIGVLQEPLAYEPQGYVETFKNTHQKVHIFLTVK